MEHFARILPITGTSLFDKQVALFGLPAAAEVVRYLAANGVRRWVWVTDEKMEAEQLLNDLMAQHGAALPLEVALYSVPNQKIDVVVAVGEEVQAAAKTFARERGAPLISAPAHEGWDARCFAPLLALEARERLLGRHITPAHPDPAENLTPAERRRGRLLIAGLGSLGSIAAQHLAPYVEALVLADPDSVEPYNPVRQAYPRYTIGQQKAPALAELLTHYVPHITPLARALTDASEVEELVKSEGVTAALVVTGTHHDFEIARGLEAAGVSHVVGRCYPRARYWEGVVVEEGLPAFEEVRGHIRMGPAPAPTPEQRRAYSEAGALEAEPATLIESGWAAAWLARLMWQLTLPPGLREGWMLRALSARQSCFIGGIHAEMTTSGWAYGIEQPGQVRAYGVAQVAPIAPPPPFQYRH